MVELAPLVVATVGVLGALLSGGILMAGVGVMFRVSEARERQQREAFAAIGLSGGPVRYWGVVAGRHVHLHAEQRRSGDHSATWYHTEVLVPELPEGFTVVPDTPFASGQDTTIGDPPFDLAFRVGVQGGSLGLSTSPPARPSGRTPRSTGVRCGASPARRGPPTG